MFTRKQLCNKKIEVLENLLFYVSLDQTGGVGGGSNSFKRVKNQTTNAISNERFNKKGTMLCSQRDNKLYQYHKLLKINKIQRKIKFKKFKLFPSQIEFKKLIVHNSIYKDTCVAHHNLVHT